MPVMSDGLPLLAEKLLVEILSLPYALEVASRKYTQSSHFNIGSQSWRLKSKLKIRKSHLGIWS